MPRPMPRTLPSSPDRPFPLVPAGRKLGRRER